MNRFIVSQIEARARLDTEMAERAYAKLVASVSEPGQAPTFTTDELEEADGAARACLKYLHVTPGDVPQKVQDTEERIAWLCRPSGTMRRNVRLEDKWYQNVIGAMMGKLNTGDPIALLPRGVSGYYYLEPGTGKKVRVTRATAAKIEPEAILFYKPLPAKKLCVRDLVTFVFRVFSRGDYLLVLAATVIATILGLIPITTNQVAFDVVVPSGQEGLVMPLGALLAGVAISTALIRACRNLIMARVSTKLDVVTEAAAFARVLALPPSFFKEYASGDLASRVSNVTAIAQKMTTFLLGSGLSAVFSLVYILQIGRFAPALALPTLAIALIQATLTVAVVLLTVPFEHRTMETSAELSGTVTALLNGIQKIKLAGAEERAFARWADGYADYAASAYNRPKLLRALPALVALVGLLGGIAIYYLAGTTGVGVDDYMAFNVAYGQVSGAIMALASTAGQVASINPMFGMVAPILETVPETSDDKPNVEDLSGNIEMSGVSFRYDDNQPYVIDGLSFKVRPGEYVALVGKSGCGKSTILRLLLGLEKPERGTILFGRYDVQKVDLRSLRRHVGVVMQDGKLFMGDIFSNITVSTPTATLEDAWEAAELAGIADDIRKMPMGMQTLLTEGGGGVSGGQRQRLMIARAVCCKRRILMFDEATSALDNVTQKHVSDSLDSLECTRIIVAHRLSTIRHCDRILVLDGGKIVEEGSYEELIERNGMFAELVARQQLDE